MKGVPSLNHTDEQQSYHGNDSPLSCRYEKGLNKTDLFLEQLFSTLTTSNSTGKVILGLTFLISIVGMVGNGNVIWLLGFRVKRNKFTIYLLNLAIADFSTLVAASALIVLMVINVLKMADVKTVQFFFWGSASFTYSVGLYLVTAIAVERCLCMLFPICFHFHRPKDLSTIVSVFFWTVCGLLTIINSLLHYYCLIYTWNTVVRIICGVNLFIFTPVMAVSTLILFIKMCFRQQPRTPHTIILPILLFFVTTAVPYNTFFFLNITDYNFHTIALPIYMMLVVLNSSINPIIYFFVGNQGNGRSQESTKSLFQGVFKDETENAEVS